MRIRSPLVLATLACAPYHPEGATGPAALDWSAVTRALDSAVAVGAAPGAVLGVSAGGVRFFHATGRLGEEDPTAPTPGTLYDLASLTKVVGLTTALMIAVGEGRLDLDAPVRRYLPGCTGPGKDRITPRMLLAHAAGLSAWRPLYREAGGRAELLAQVEATPLEAPPGTRESYSDLGAILLTATVERIYGERIDRLLQRRVFGPLGMRDTRYLPPPEWRPRVAPTENDPWRGRVLRGEVHDENAAAMAGVSGHAGLFGTGEDLLTFAEWLLAALGGRPTPALPLSREVAREFVRRQELVPGSTRALGWDTPGPASSAGTLLPATSIGHTGFTGTSLWIDPSRDLAIVLLSNRVHPTRDNSRWAPVRARVADLVLSTLAQATR